MAKHTCIPTTIRGVLYPSIRAAAEAMRCSESTIINHRKAGTLDQAGVRKTRKPNVSGSQNGTWQKRPVTIRGVNYDSIGEASLALGISPSAISHAKKRDYLETVGLGHRGRLRNSERTQ